MRLVRDYSRVFHTPTDGLLRMPVNELAEEIADANEEIREENLRREKEQKKAEARARKKGRRRH